MYDEPDDIARWLLQSDSHVGGPDGVPADPRPLSSKKCALEMATPSVSAPRSSSSKKRKLDRDATREAGSAPDGDADAAPRLGRSAIIPLHPSSLIFPLASASASASGSVTDTNHSSSPSPVKNIVGLQRLEKPVLFGSLHDNAEEGQLPDDVRQLFSDIWAIVATQGIYPAEVRDEIMRLNRKTPPSHFRQPETWPGPSPDVSNSEDPFFDLLPIWAFGHAAKHPSMTPKRLARAELHHVRHLESVARECWTRRKSEASWNSNVHEPLLALALWRYCDTVAIENATAARILPAFIPALTTGEAVEGKTVDFVLSPIVQANNLVPPGAASEDAGLAVAAAIQNKLAAQPSAGFCDLGVNHTDYSPLLCDPIAVTIETKIGGASTEEGRLQLGIWTAAWHARMSALGVGGGKQGPLLPTLPLILTHDHAWSLYFAADRGFMIVSSSSLLPCFVISVDADATDRRSSAACILARQIQFRVSINCLQSSGYWLSG